MLDRRNFVLTGAAISATTAVAAEQNPSQGTDLDRLVRVGVMGLSRGQSLALDLAKLKNVEVKYLCDVDQLRTTSALKEFHDKTGKSPEVVNDFRRILDDKSIDALVCAAPNHWHAPATIMACKAGKHVYVEKPCSHNPQEGEWMIQAAEQFDRCVQMGTQRRSSPGALVAMEKLHAGAIGTPHLARCYYNNLRPSLGRGATTEPPKGLDYELWQGPAPHRAYRDNVVHYNWHWFWHWGGGELANNGVHGLDLCRWGLRAGYPIRTVSSGGRYWYDDDQETPDVQSACFEYEGNKQITWDALSCNKHGVEFICAFYGDQGSLELDADGKFRIYDRNNKQVEESASTSAGQPEHLQNFVQAVRASNRSLLNQPIPEGHKSTLLCHLGNIAYRTGRTVNCDASSGRILEDSEQIALWRRDYAPAWESDVTMS